MCMSWGKTLHCILSPFLPFISTERPHTLFSAACVHGIHGKVLQAFVNTQERKCQGRLMGEVKSSWKKFRSSLSQKGNLKGWLCDYEHFSCWISSSQGILLMASSAYLLQSTLPLQGRWPATTMSWHTQKCYTDHSDNANTCYLTPLCVQPTPGTHHAERGLLSRLARAAHHLFSPPPSHQGIFSYHLLFNLSYWPVF